MEQGCFLLCGWSVGGVKDFCKVLCSDLSKGGLVPVVPGSIFFKDRKLCRVTSYTRLNSLMRSTAKGACTVVEGMEEVVIGVIGVDKLAMLEQKILNSVLVRRIQLSFPRGCPRLFLCATNYLKHLSIPEPPLVIWSWPGTSGSGFGYRRLSMLSSDSIRKSSGLTYQLWARAR